MIFIEPNIVLVIIQIVKHVEYQLKHDDTITQVEHVFRENGSYTTREYQIFKIKDSSARAGRIDLVARKSKFRVAI